MGMFDEFRRRFRGESTGRTAESVAELPGPSARYLFAHMALPQIAFDSPGRFLMLMSESNPRRAKMLQDIWRQVREHCPWDAEAARTRPEFRIDPFLLLGWCGILVGLPEPRRPAEAYFACVVVRLPKAAAGPPATPPPTRFFTLERADDGLARLLHVEDRSRIAAALREDPMLLPVLMKETMFRGAFLRDLEEKLRATKVDEESARACALLMSDPAALARAPSRLASVLDVYERPADHPPTVLGGWTAEGTHMNFGTGPRPEKWAFLADLAVLLATSDVDHSGRAARRDPGDA